MCRNWMRGIGILALGFSTVAALQSTTVAEAAVGEKGTVLHELRAAHKLLVEADHDYDGHRAIAAEEVHKAIHDLEGKHAPKKVESGTTALTSTPVVAKIPKEKAKPREAQGTSDDQLKEALAILKNAQSQLTTSHPNAANITEAIANLNTALSIK